MKIAAIKAQMGIWRYYISAMTFEDIAEYVSPITEEISNSDSYSNILQRTITDNVDGVKEYLLEQPERLFNSLVLAIYNGNPEWYELEVNVEEYSTYCVGVLEITKEETIFPVDGQHRVEGIKKAIEIDPSIRNEKVPVIFIGHENTDEGKRRTRRLFSTLNRRAKRVKDNEIIALDEDDVVAIATRELAEKHVLFLGDRLIDCPNKNIPSSNKVSFTSILTLYEANRIIFEDICTKKGMTRSQREKYLRYRPCDEEVEAMVEEISTFWTTLVEYVPIIRGYIELDEEKIVEENYRSAEGGNLLFRPIALSQFVRAIILYKNRKGLKMSEACKRLGKIPMLIQEKPWKNFLWLDERKTINGRVRKDELMYLMLFLADETVLKEKELKKLIQYILSSRELDASEYDNILAEIREYAIGK